MKNYDFYLNKFTGYFLVLFCLLAAYSCKQKVEDFNNPTLVAEKDVSQLVDGLIHFIGEQDLHATQLDDNYINSLNKEIELLTGQPSNYTLAEANELKGAIIDLFEGHDMTKALAHPWITNDKRLISIASFYKNKIVKRLGDLTSIESIEEAIDQMRVEAQATQSFTPSDLEFVNNQLNITERIISNIYIQYSNGEKGIKCKWYQWICVAGATAAAIALIATGAGAAAIIAGGGTVAIVAACCICGCTCTFTDSCQDPDPCDGISCPAGSTCDNGVCVTVADPCDGVNCPYGYECVNGNCRSKCYGVHCIPGYHCVNGNCVVDPFFEGCSNFNPCPPWESCIQGICVPW